MLHDLLTLAAIGASFLIFITLIAASWGEFSNDEENELHNERN
jgi:hypothetical protein